MLYAYCPCLESDRSALPAFHNTEQTWYLHAVGVNAIDHVAEVDEDVCGEKALPEIHWAAHFRHQFDEKRGATKREDSVHEPVDVVNDTKAGWCRARDLDRIRIVDVEIRV